MSNCTPTCACKCHGNTCACQGRVRVQRADVAELREKAGRS